MPENTATANAANETSQRVLRNWLECMECEDGQLDSLRNAVKASTQPAITILSTSLLKGPSQGRIFEVREQFRDYHRTLTSFAVRKKLPPPAMTEAEYVDHYTGAYTYTYRVRAEQALKAIGGAQATQALDSAAKLGNLPSAAARAPVKR